MNKNIYLFLSWFSLVSTLGVAYYAFTLKPSPAEIVVQVKTPVEVATSTTKEYTTKTGAIFTLEESHPNGMSLSTVTVVGKNFKEESSVTFEKDTVQNVFVNDIDNNGFSELYIITQSAGSGSYGELVAIISNKDISFSKVELPKLSSEDMATSSPFEGYEGHDSYAIENGYLIRSFPIKTATNTQETKTLKKVTYKLVEDGEAFAFILISEIPTTTATATTTRAVATSTSASSTPKTTTPNKTATTTTSTSTKTTTNATSTKR